MELFSFTWHVLSLFPLFYYFQRCANKMHFKPQLTINKHVFTICTKDLKPRSMSEGSIQRNWICFQNLHICTASTACMHFGKRVYFIFTTCTENSYNFAQNKTASVDSHSIINIQIFRQRPWLKLGEQLRPLCTNSVLCKIKTINHYSKLDWNVNKLSFMTLKNLS